MIIDLVSPKPLYAPDGGDGGGGGTGDKGADGDKGSAGDTVSKADHDKVVGDMEKLKQDLEDTRLEVMTPDYIEFLNTKSKGSGAPADKGTPIADELKGLSPEQIYAKAISDSKKSAAEEAAKLREEFSATSREATQKEIAAFARSHTDYEQFRPLMYGLSLAPNHKDATLQELYDAAKEHIKRIHTEPTKEEKDRSRRSGGEKPGSSSSAVIKDKKYTPEEAALEAWNEVVGKEGLPSA